MLNNLDNKEMDLTEAAGEFLAQNAKDVIKGLATVVASGLPTLLEFERSAEKPRKSVIEAIEKAIEESPDEDKPILGRNLTERDARAIDHSQAIDMRFIKDGYHETEFGQKIEGRTGQICALNPGEVEKAVEAGLMEVIEQDEDETEE